MSHISTICSEQRDSNNNIKSSNAIKALKYLKGQLDIKFNFKYNGRYLHVGYMVVQTTKIVFLFCFVSCCTVLWKLSVSLMVSQSSSFSLTIKKRHFHSMITSLSLHLSQSAVAVFSSATICFSNIGRQVCTSVLECRVFFVTSKMCPVW